MNIAIERNVHVGVPKHFTQSFDLKAYLNATSSKCMSESMKISISYTAILDIRFEAILHCTRFNIPVISGQNIGFRIRNELTSYIYNK